MIKNKNSIALSELKNEVELTRSRVENFKIKYETECGRLSGLESALKIISLKDSLDDKEIK